MAKNKPQKIDHKAIQDALDFGRKLIAKEGDGAEAYLITFHVIKPGNAPGEKKIVHHFNYHGFPTGDWGPAMIAIGVEAKRAALVAQTGSGR